MSVRRADIDYAASHGDCLQLPTIFGQFCVDTSRLLLLTPTANNELLLHCHKPVSAIAVVEHQADHLTLNRCTCFLHSHYDTTGGLLASDSEPMLLSIATPSTAASHWCLRRLCGGSGEASSWRSTELPKRCARLQALARSSSTATAGEAGLLAQDGCCAAVSAPSGAISCTGHVRESGHSGAVCNSLCLPRIAAGLQLRR